MHYSELVSAFSFNGWVECSLGNHKFKFDLSQPHERQYLAKILFDIRVPQVDIDSMLFRKFVMKGDRVLDAGANIGFTSIELISIGASFVVAVEPIPMLFDRLCALTNESNIDVMAAAISDVNGIADIWISRQHNQGSTLNPKIRSKFDHIFNFDDEPIKAKLISIDDISIEKGRFDIWKLDIEGAEVKALLGAKDTLKNMPPRIIIVEIYDEFIQEFKDIIFETHPYFARAFIAKSNYQLCLESSNEYDISQYEQTSPMYIFSQNEFLLSSIK
jgi:FkbM family methyltransferase